MLALLRRSLCLFWRETHTKDRWRDFPRDQKWRRKGSFPGKTERASWQSRAEEDGQLEIAVQGKDGQQKEAVREDSQRWVSISSGFKKFRAKHTPVIVYKYTKSCTKSSQRLPFLALGADPSPCLFVCSFSPTFSDVLCIYVMKCVIPLVGNEKKTTRRITGYEKFGWTTLK